MSMSELLLLLLLLMVVMSVLRMCPFSGAEAGAAAGKEAED